MEKQNPEPEAAKEEAKPAEVVRLPYLYGVLGQALQVEMPPGPDGKPQPSIHLRPGGTIELSAEELSHIGKERPELIDQLRCLAPVVTTTEPAPTISEGTPKLSPELDLAKAPNIQTTVPSSETVRDTEPVTADESGNRNRGRR